MLICGLVTRAQANAGNYQPYIVGERAAGMGGCACAIARNADAAYHNPAGLASTRRSSVSFMASLYGFQRYRIDDALHPNENFDVNTFTTIPSTMGSVFNINTNLTIALGVFIPDQNSVSEIETFVEQDHYYNFSMDDELLWAGPAAGLRLSPQLAIGAGMYLSYRNYSSLESFYWGDQMQSYAANIKYRSYDLLGTLGIQYAWSNGLRAGLLYQSPTLHLYGSGKYQAHIVSAQTDHIESETAYGDNLDSEYAIPPRITCGLACTKPEYYSVGMDITYHFSGHSETLKGSTRKGDPIKGSMHRQAVWDFNIGGEYYAFRRYPLRLGFFTSHSAFSAPEAVKNETAQIDLYGITASVGHESAHVNMNVGINYVFGHGHAIGWKEQDGVLKKSRVDARETHLYVFVTTSYLF
jgi:hypothetical protein